MPKTELLQRQKKIKKGKAFIVSTVQEELTPDEIKGRMKQLDLKEQQLNMALLAIQKQIENIKADREMFLECLGELEPTNGGEEDGK